MGLRGGQAGFGLVEMLVALTLSMIVLVATVSILTIYLNDNRYAGYRDQAQRDGQVMLDRISRELRNAASPTSGSAGLLEKASSYDLVFQTVSPAGGSSSNSTNQMRVRYCLDGNLTLWRQTETWTSSTAPAVPDTSACPSTSTSWVTTSGGGTCCKVLTDVTNEIGGDTTRPLFIYGPTGYASTSQIKEVEVSMYLDLHPGKLPGPTQITGGIYLRNELSSPVASFTVTQTAKSSSTRDLTLNASFAYDPNGQALSYQWYSAGTCPSPTTAVSGATSQSYDAGTYNTNTNQTFLLVVTDTGGLTSCTSQTVAVQ